MQFYRIRIRTGNPEMLISGTGYPAQPYFVYISKYNKSCKKVAKMEFQTKFCMGLDTNPFLIEIGITHENLIPLSL